MQVTVIVVGGSCGSSHSIGSGSSSSGVVVVVLKVDQ